MSWQSCFLLGTAWSGGEWDRTVRTRRRQWGQREHDGNQKEILGTKGRQWGPGGDDGDQEESMGKGGKMMATKR